MLKILYAADNRPSSFYSLKRFLDSYSKFYVIKTAAYSKSINNINVNWNLDALLDFRGKFSGIYFKNSNCALYTREIKEFAPDVVISDLEIYTSYIALELGIKVWQVSPLLLYYGIENKHNIYKYYSGALRKNHIRNIYMEYVLNNSKKFVLSHLGDFTMPPILNPHYEWIRPNYHLINDDAQYIHIPSSAIHLADAYFNNKLSTLEVDFSDSEAIITSKFNYYYKLSAASNNEIIPFKTTINQNVKFLSQYLETL